MATVPLFVASLATLKQMLRLTGVPSAGDAAEMVLEGIRRARLAFHRRLGSARVAVLVAMTYDDTPDDDNELLRILANSVEVKLVHTYLLDTLPTMFMDGSGNAQEIWNDEAPYRSGPVPESTKARLKAEIEEDMALLAGEVEFGDETSWKITLNEPDEAPPEPGATAFEDSGSMFASTTEDEGD